MAEALLTKLTNRSNLEGPISIEVFLGNIKIKNINYFKFDFVV